MPKKETSYQRKFRKQKALGLSDRNIAFIEEYCKIDNKFNASRAYQRVYSDKSNSAHIKQLLDKHEIQTGIEIEREHLHGNHEKLVNAILGEWIKWMATDITQFQDYDAKNDRLRLKNLNQIPKELHSAIKKLRNTQNGVEIELIDKVAVSRMLGESLGMFIERKQDVSEDYESMVERISNERQKITDQSQ